MIQSKETNFGHPMFIQIPRIKKEIPIWILFRALGLVSDKEICQVILLNLDDAINKKLLTCMKAYIISANDCITQEDAFEYIMKFAMFTPINMDQATGLKKKREFTQKVLDNDLFPHCNTRKEKIYFLGYMVKRLIQVSLNLEPSDDRDSYVNKRLELTGTLLNNLFRNYLNKLIKDMQKQIVREINNGSWRAINDFVNIVNKTNVGKIVKSSTIENGIKRALATGDFGIKSLQSTKVGIAQVLNRLNYASTLSHLRRVNTPIDKSGKLIPPRKLHNTQFGFICPYEVPEGHSVGVVKNKSFMAIVTIYSDVNIIYDNIKSWITPLDELLPHELYRCVKVIVNGNWVGIVEQPMVFYRAMKEKKYEGILNRYTSVVFDCRKMEIRLCNDAGRLVRPLLIVDPTTGRPYITKEICRKVQRGELSWDDLLCNHKLEHAVLEYIDAEEQNYALISMNHNVADGGGVNGDKAKYDYAELHPSTILGVLGSCIPFPDHNQSPRNTYQCAMGKQAMGMFATNHHVRMDKTSYVQTYVAQPLVNTHVMNMIGLHNIPSGFTAIVAIMTYSGYNQEDSLIFNQAALDRGLFHATIYHTERDEDKKINGDEEIRCRPIENKTKGMKFANYNSINHQGVVPTNSLIRDKDIILGKVIPIKENKNDMTKTIKYADQSKIFRTCEETYIDYNFVQTNGDGYTFAKTKTRAPRKPQIGDKFSSRHGQKGTIGMVLSQDDMPFTEDGIVPDIIINPHCIPSRMTIGQLKETLLGKVLVQLGLFGNGNCFNKKLTIELITEELSKTAYNRHGEEWMTNGMTGERIKSSVFIGPVYYQRLKHMVRDKVHSRAIGPMVVMTRQPSEGRARDGGLRFGEMERDCMLAYGTGKFVNERMYISSDKYQINSCSKCGLMAVYNNEKHTRV